MRARSCDGYELPALNADCESSLRNAAFGVIEIDLPGNIVAGKAGLSCRLHYMYHKLAQPRLQC